MWIRGEIVERALQAFPVRDTFDASRQIRSERRRGASAA
jgi:hypothetical protein